MTKLQPPCDQVYLFGDNIDLVMAPSILVVL